MHSTSALSTRAATRPADASIETFRAALRGDVVQAGDDGYDAARRIWNGAIDRRPALIAYCEDEADVRTAIHFAQRQALPLAVRAGGHNVAGSAVCDGGLVLDLSRMKSIRVDPAARRAFVAAGVTIGELDRATQPYGLAAPLGVVTDTGIAGLTLGGGLGWLRRKHGLSCDALRGADVVTADGRLVHASEAENPDLFWALRGGGGNFGVVTRFEYELYPVGPEVFFTAVFYPISKARAALRLMRNYVPTTPEAFSPLAFLTHVPPLEVIDASHHGKPCIVLAGPYADDPREGERIAEPLRALGTPILDLSSTMPYLQAQQFFDEDYPRGGRYYWTSINLTELGDEAVEHLVALNDQAPSAHSTLDVWFNGGAMSRVDAGATAFGDRSAPIMIGVEANWHEAADDEANKAWARRTVETLRRFSDGRMYLNFPGSEEEGGRAVRRTFGPNYARLSALKRVYDPENLFRTHQNITPA